MVDLHVSDEIYNVLRNSKYIKGPVVQFKGLEGRKSKRIYTGKFFALLKWPIAKPMLKVMACMYLTNPDDIFLP